MLIKNIASDSVARRSEYSKRNKLYDEETFETALLNARQESGWTLTRENKSSVRMRKAKPLDEILENRFWATLYRFGYSELNEGRNFKIPLAKIQTSTHKQIDVFAKDDETVVIAECKSCELPSRRSMLKDLNEFAGLMKPIADAVRLHYGKNFNPKFIWCFVTDNVRWSDQDLQRAKEHNIKVIRELELMYFEEFSKKIGPAARYQFHAEYLENQKVPALSGRKVPAVKTKIGGSTAYMFSALPTDVLRIAFVNHRDLRDPAGAPSYQRVVKPNRLRQIGAFLDDKGYFPNSILLNFHRSPNFEPLTKDSVSGIVFGNLVLPDRYKSCWVIDGQHRLYGTMFTKVPYTEPLFFIAFDSISPAQEANIFVEINAKQATVPPALLSALDGEVKWDSDVPKERLAAIASRAVDLLNSKGHGPLEGKVGSPGIVSGTSQPLNLRSIQERIVMTGIVATVNNVTNEIVPGPCWRGSSESTLARLVALLNLHFDIIRDSNPARWEAGRLGLLCTNLGIASHIRLLSELIRYIEFKNNIVSSALELQDLYGLIQPYISKFIEFNSNSSDEEFRAHFTVIFGSTGYHQYYYKLFALIKDSVPDFVPEGYDEFMHLRSKEVVDRADRQVKWIQTVVPLYIRDKLREKFGENYFDQVVPREIQKQCQTKRIDDESENKLAVEAYLDWIHCATLAYMPEIREEVKAALSIKLPQDSSGKHFYRTWFNELNKIRRVAAHPSDRNYSVDQIETLDLVTEHLQNSLPDSYRKD